MKTKKYENKIVVITGGTSGIGLELAKIYENGGATVCVLAHQIFEERENCFLCDVTSEEQVKNSIESIGGKFGKIDIVINCAGYGLAGALELIPFESAKHQVDTNLLGTFLVNKYAIKYMKENSCIINISSACALFALPYRGLYSASKAGVDMYSKCLKMELAPSKINVVSICPGDTKTNFSKNRVKVFETNERYGNRIKRSIDKVEGNQEKRMSPVFVAKRIEKIACKKHPKPMYIIGAKYHVLYFFSKILPQSVMMHFTQKMFNK